MTKSQQPNYLELESWLLELIWYLVLAIWGFFFSASSAENKSLLQDLFQLGHEPFVLFGKHDGHPQSFPAHGPYDYALLEQGVVEIAAVELRLEHDEVRLRRDVGNTELAEGLIEKLFPFVVQSDRHLNVFPVRERRKGADLAERVCIERLPHLVHQLRDLGCGDAVAYTKPCKAIDLGKRPEREHRFARLEVVQGFGIIRPGDILAIRFVNGNDHVVRHAAHKALHLRRRVHRARRVVRKI